MVKCSSCGFNVEQEEVVRYEEYSTSTCVRCKNCNEHPELREAYRRGFNAGLDALAAAVQHIVQKSNLRKNRPE